MENTASTPVRLSTADVAPRDRADWLREVIGREYVRVEIRPPDEGGLFNEMTIRPWGAQRLSRIRSGAIGIDRLAGEPTRKDQDAYFAVILLAGRYSLEQDGRSAILRPGDMALYDATRPHRIRCPGHFSKLILSIPRPVLSARLPGAERCTALRIPGNQGIGAVTSNFVRVSAAQAACLSREEIDALSERSVDLLTLALASVRPADRGWSRGRSASLQRIKNFIERHLPDPGLDASTVAGAVGLSSRYINDLFKNENTSLMRHVWLRRLENCRRDLADPAQAGRSVSDIALRWGYNDLSHFSRSFRQRYGLAPRDYRRRP
ncbi:helix-turn-helix domain-containing protein [Methylococcus sp. EFPC2]|uniref:AraC-like ligand-binding domain-containing protein n=1 Tax=Methylococcus sp. EFPC2 TaxID=2812648 RepID=UPI0019686606|nr:helix-turn-helix domain-containing protein [Methylococcus sp. EFPC2]QSA97233.1 helix-turn-helix domain-containing protein [Methylococcus sp. EFPC2]